MSRKKWVVASLDKELASDIAEEYGIDPFAALLLVSRGITDEGEIAEFFSESTALISPFELKDMDKAVERISRAMDEGEKIAVYGDYDADGVTSTALMYRFFEMNGCDVITYIPDRNSEGYGLNKNAIKSLKEQGAELIITVDNGISAFEEAEYIYELGMELVITDHHKAGDSIPRAEAVVDPHRRDCPCPYKLWAGVGVAFKVICALSGADDEEMLSMFSDLVTIGTIGDIVPLTGENRAIVKHGLRQNQKLHFRSFLCPACNPSGIILGCARDKLLPTGHGVKVAQSGLLPAVELLAGEGVVVVFAAVDHAVALCQHPHHGGFARVGSTVDKIDIFEQITIDIGFNSDFHRVISISDRLVYSSLTRMLLCSVMPSDS